MDPSTVARGPSEITWSRSPRTAGRAIAHLRPVCRVQLPRTAGGKEGAASMGCHLEGPFISKRKKGAHPEHLVTGFPGGMKDVVERYVGCQHLAECICRGSIGGTMEVPRFPALTLCRCVAGSVGQCRHDHPGAGA